MATRITIVTDNGNKEIKLTEYDNFKLEFQGTVLKIYTGYDKEPEEAWILRNRDGSYTLYEPWCMAYFLEEEKIESEEIDALNIANYFPDGMNS